MRKIATKKPHDYRAEWEQNNECDTQEDSMGDKSLFLNLVRRLMIPCYKSLEKEYCLLRNQSW